VATRKGAGTTARKKYVPSEKQRADDERLRKQLQNLTDADMEKFERTLSKAIKPLISQIR
jgi:hypothetical protein